VQCADRLRGIAKIKGGIDLNIVVLAGGYSPERDVSLSSGSLIANALMKTGHKVLMLDLYEGIDLEELSEEQYQTLFCDNKTYTYKVPSNEPNLEELRKNSNNGRSLIGKNVLELCKYSDIVFIALHGGIGENGQIQAMLDNLRN